MPGANRLLLVGLVGFAFMEAMASSTASSECVPSACLVKYCVADRTDSRNLRCSSVILCGSSLMGIILLLQLFASGLTHGGAFNLLFSDRAVPLVLVLVPVKCFTYATR